MNAGTDLMAEGKELRLIKSEPYRDLKEGKIKDFVTGKWIKDTPEEQVRQIFEKRLAQEYGYSRSQMDINFMIQKGSKKIGPADIVVFRTSRRTFDNLYIIVEIKREERQDGIDQLKSYLSPSPAEFGVWFNGREIVYIHSRKKTPPFRVIPDIPQRGETLEDVGLYQKKDLRPATELKTIFETCHNYIYANEGLLKEKVFNEMLKLIFMKMVDEKSASSKCEFRITDKEMDEIEEGKANAFRNRISNLFQRVRKEYGDVFSEHERINLRPVTVAFVVSQLQKYSLTDTSADVKGTAFQTFVYAHERGERGEFFTPYPILELAVGILDPQDHDSVLDPACGSGGFLITSMKHVWKLVDRSRTDLSEAKRKDMKIKYARVYLRGIDINPDLARVAKMHMILYDDGHTGIISANSLEPFEIIDRAALEAGAGHMKPESFSLVMTNPPFGEKGQVTDKKILAQFDLGHKWKKDRITGKWHLTNELRDGQTPEILFIERCLQFLKFGGRMAKVIPDTILTSSTHEYVREYIKTNARILGMISLPRETFIPHGAGSKTTLLFLQKLPKEQIEKLGDYVLFRSICEKIGYDRRGRTIFNRDDFGDLILDENGDPIVDTDIPEIVHTYKEFRQRTKETKQ